MMVSATMNHTADGMPKGRIWAIMNSGGRLEIHSPAVALIRPPLRIDSMPSVTTMDGIRV